MYLIRTLFICFFFNDTATTEIYTLSLHDALPICVPGATIPCSGSSPATWTSVPAITTAPSSSAPLGKVTRWTVSAAKARSYQRSEEHTSELQSRQYLVCRLLLEKKKRHYSSVIDA